MRFWNKDSVKYYIPFAMATGAELGAAGFGTPIGRTVGNLLVEND